MKNSDRWLVMALLSACVLLGGCTRTIQEKKSTGSDQGNITQLKFTGSKMKVEHDF